VPHALGYAILQILENLKIVLVRFAVRLKVAQNAKQEHWGNWRRLDSAIRVSPRVRPRLRTMNMKKRLLVFAGKTELDSLE
jgi:hypothetical protein